MDKIVVLKDMADLPGVRIAMDSSKERAITVDCQDKVYKFKECQEVLYYYDTDDYNYISDATDNQILQLLLIHF